MYPRLNILRRDQRVKIQAIGLWLNTGIIKKRKEKEKKRKEVNSDCESSIQATNTFIGKG